MEHEIDEYGEPIHIDVDTAIPTGICAVCNAEEESDNG